MRKNIAETTQRHYVSGSTRIARQFFRVNVTVAFRGLSLSKSCFVTPSEIDASMCLDLSSKLGRLADNTAWSRGAFATIATVMK